MRHQLEEILVSSAFRGSKRCRDFLQYVVTKVLDGEADNLKERTLAIEVFGRKADAGLGEDSIVRVGAREVRKRLAQYYVTDGAANQVRIDLPPGSYVPVFHFHSDGAETLPVEPAVAEPVPEPEVPPQPKSRWPLWALAAALALAALGIWRLTAHRADEFDAFWAPALAQKSPVIITLAHPLVYHPSTRANQLNEQHNPGGGLPFQLPIRVPPQLLNGSDFVPVIDQYVGFGDAVAATRLATLFSRNSRQFRIRLASQIEFSDLRDSSAILLGSFTNRWTMELSRNYKYRMGMTAARKPAIVSPADGKQWSLADKSDNGASAEDYILICRLTRGQTGGFLVMGAGLTQYGTEEAGRILSDPDALDALLHRIDPKWRNQNLELVLHTRIVGNAPTSPEIVVSHIW